MSTRIEKCQGQLIVYFEDPFWVGVFERIENGKLSAAKVTFGAEPKEYEVQEFMYMGNKILDDGVNKIPGYQYRIRMSCGDKESD